MLVEPTMEYEGVRGLTGHWRAVTPPDLDTLGVSQYVSAGPLLCMYIMLYMSKRSLE